MKLRALRRNMSLLDITQSAELISGLHKRFHSLTELNPLKYIPD